jgi:hypothetical protein
MKPLEQSFEDMMRRGHCVKSPISLKRIGPTTSRWHLDSRPRMALALSMAFSIHSPGVRFPSIA